MVKQIPVDSTGLDSAADSGFSELAFPVFSSIVLELEISNDF